ncbi:MAG: hypothetical protein GXP35_05475 [Actinobacteria bacterium]|nr:hypothetical protein [Actinomycetota bacterium]
MQIVAALFVDNFDIRQEADGSARLDLTGVHFSTSAMSDFPIALEPHLIVLVRCPADHGGLGALEVKFMRDETQIARNVQPLQIDPGKFNYRLVKAELSWDEPGTIEAHCCIDQGPVTVVPLTVNPPA